MEPVRRHTALIAAIGALLASVVAGCGSAGARPATATAIGAGTTTRAAAASAAAISVTSTQSAHALPAGFVGLSMEYKGFAAYAGSSARAVDPVFEQLLRDISPGQSTVLRIGGDSSDWTWWPVPGMKQPLGIRYSLTPAALAVVHKVASDLDARLILGLNLEADSVRIASAEASALDARVGRSYIDALELGNEPELYGSFGWYRTAAGVEVPGRPRGYDFADFAHDFATFSRALPAGPLAGPSAGGPEILSQLGTFLGEEHRVSLVTVHAYPLKHCTRSQLVTESELLANSSSAGLAQTVAPLAAAAADHGEPLRIDEMNAVSCGGFRGVSDTFGSALWALDTLFEMDKLGVDGVNIHTVPGTINEMLGPELSGGHWSMHVHPEFYGMVLFSQAAPVGSRLLRLSASAPAGVKVWATRATNGQIRVTVINKNTRGATTVHLHIPAAQGAATLIRLTAPGVQATSGITLGGQSFGSRTTTGLLAGHASSSTVTPLGGVYTVTAPAGSAALLTLPAG
jgi:hypothetical protein